MSENMNEKELESLISLLDDPDQEVFQHVEQKLITLGTTVIEQLESVWEQSFDALQQTRIENLIHKIQFQSVRRELEIWKLGGAADLLRGMIIVDKYQYPDLDEQQVINRIEAIKRDAWLDMIYDLSPAENVRLLNNVLYNVHGLSGNTGHYHDPQNSFISKVLETKKGNPLLLAAIYSIVAQRLDIPIYGVNLPKHFILAYTRHHLPIDDREDILFYINAFSRGHIFGRHDVIGFLKQLNLNLEDQFMVPCSNVDIIIRVLRNLSAAYTRLGQTDKKEEIEILLSVVMED